MPSQCRGVALSGKRCQRHVEARYCALHADQCRGIGLGSLARRKIVWASKDARGRKRGIHLESLAHNQNASKRVPPSPCETCHNYRKCATEKLACAEFYLFDVAKAGKSECLEKAKRISKQSPFTPGTYYYDVLFNGKRK